MHTQRWSVAHTHSHIHTLNILFRSTFNRYCVRSSDDEWSIETSSSILNLVSFGISHVGAREKLVTRCVCNFIESSFYFWNSEMNLNLQAFETAIRLLIVVNFFYSLIFSSHRANFPAHINALNFTATQIMKRKKNDGFRTLIYGIYRYIYFPNRQVNASRM